MRAFLDVSHVQSLRVGVKWERGNSGAGARGAREEGENPWELVKILIAQQFIPAPRLFRISYKMGCIICIIIKYFFAN